MIKICIRNIKTKYKWDMGETPLSHLKQDGVTYSWAWQPGRPEISWAKPGQVGPGLGLNLELKHRDRLGSGSGSENT